jgi:two-component system, NarL family, response regulator DevR
MKVFLVEDSPMLRERVQAILASVPGTQAVGHAATAQAAIAGIQSARPDIVVLDIQLEEGSGFEVMQVIRKLLPEVKFYVLTNFANEAYQRKAERLGACGFFDKSREFEQLRETLLGILRP